MATSDPSLPAKTPDPLIQLVDGFPVPVSFPVDSFRSALGYKPRPDDIFLVTYPKCGTTWAQGILLLIFRHGEPLTSYLQFHSASPFLEITGAEGGKNMPRPGAIKCHLPHHLTPRSDEAKYIYIARNPKDCCVSYFHHMLNIPGKAFTGTFDQFFELFMSGNVHWGDYFDHLLGWYAHRNDPNVLFLTYEQMKENPEDAVMKMASFMDDKLYAEPLRRDPEKLRRVVHYSSFKHMKETINKGLKEMFQMSKEELLSSDLPDEMKKWMTSSAHPMMNQNSGGPEKVEFVRKGIIGDWKNHFTEEQSKRLDEKFAECTKGTDLPDLWMKYM